MGFQISHVRFLPEIITKILAVTKSKLERGNLLVTANFVLVTAMIVVAIALYSEIHYEIV